MRTVLGFIGLFALVLLGSAQAQYVFQGRSTPQSMRMVSGHKASAAVGYQGPGDVIGSAIAWWATSSCYNAAYSGNVMDVANGIGGSATVGSRIKCTAGGTAAAITSSTACTFLSGTTTCSPLATTCATSCGALALYDQTGNNSCGGNPCDLLTITGTAPPLSRTDLSSTFNCVTSGTNTQEMAASNNITINQAFSIAMLSKRISGTADLYGVINNGPGVGIRMGYTVSTNAASIYAGNSLTSVTASDTHYHSLVGVFANATQSVIYVDGTGNNVSLGSANGFSIAPITLFQGSTTTSVTFCEGGIWASDIGATKAANYSTNVVARYGTLP